MKNKSNILQTRNPIKEKHIFRNNDFSGVGKNYTLKECKELESILNSTSYNLYKLSDIDLDDYKERLIAEISSEARQFIIDVFEGEHSPMFYGVNGAYIYMLSLLNDACLLEKLEHVMVQKEKIDDINKLFVI